MSIYSISVQLQDQSFSTLENYSGDVLLIVNTATGCGFTPQYAGLQDLYTTYHSKGFHVLDFPCNQFNEQSPGSDDDINTFCALHYDTTFPRFHKVNVNGENAAPLFTFLKDAKGGLLNDDIKWNFTKFLVNRQGQVIKRYAPQTDPKSIAKDIEALL
ncbi:glutathione peroxidase [Carnobacteriaceae bacterium zg-ZUI252]|nr:glutathione peroxidase [Carnobacteriaceae bacterium zg-ZUI252]